MLQRKKMQLNCAIDCPHFYFYSLIQGSSNHIKAQQKQALTAISKTYILFLQKEYVRNRLPFYLILISYIKIISTFVLEIHPRVYNEERE